MQQLSQNNKNSILEGFIHIYLISSSTSKAVKVYLNKHITFE